MKVKKWPNKRCVRWPSVNARTGQVVTRGVAKCNAYLHTESREYGKKVLANYVMYKKILNEEISIIDLFDSLKEPKKTDRFRVSN